MAGVLLGQVRTANERRECPVLGKPRGWFGKKREIGVGGRKKMENQKRGLQPMKGNSGWCAVSMGCTALEGNFAVCGKNP